jgi:alkylation response protein AidB-like acyl-CoA dehydrogenase
MDFSLDSEQLMIQDTAKKLLHSLGSTDLARTYMDGNREVLSDTWRKISELGMMGINVPEEYGGIGQGMLSLVPLFEELGNALVPGPYAETLAFAVPLLNKYGSEEQKKKYLSEIASGEKIFTFALYDQHVQGIFQSALTATKYDNHYILNGVKTYVPYGREADYIIVPAKTSPDNDSISLFIVDKNQTKVSMKQLKSFDKAISLNELTFDNAVVPFNNILGVENEGGDMLKHSYNHMNTCLCSMMVGGMDRVVEMCVNHANTRKQFGNLIGSFQAVKHPIVDMKLDLESARSLTYHAAMMIDQDDRDAMLSVGSAKVFIPESYIRCTTKSIDIYGGMGFTWEIDCHLYLKRARTWENYIGSPNEYRQWCYEGMEKRLLMGADLV